MVEVMPHRTSIGWADYSSNPLKARFSDEDGTVRQGWSCVKTSPACASCYAEVINKRFGTKLGYKASDNDQAEHYVDGKELRHILRFRPKGPFKNGRGRPAVFIVDMSDLFQEALQWSRTFTT